MSAHDDEHDLVASETPGYKVTAPAKSPEEYAQMDANDESLARWKASLGIGATPAGDASGPKVTVLSMELASPTLPPGKTIALDLQNPTALADAKKVPITIKEGVEYNVLIRFKVNHSIISVRYLQLLLSSALVSRLINWSKCSDHMVPNLTHIRVIDDDKEVYADFEWCFKLAKEW
ncbi:E set domain-containing [Pyrrhoderma noxium]|uniref:E set domain-containing n=1 Tax=Pyrrhoderma noxium TaxID=2282107 RepID=A0A286UMQ4_9AGAM|nr:E set domain-containing [Pyrrhoderma noxium]